MFLEKNQRKFFVNRNDIMRITETEQRPSNSIASRYALGDFVSLR